MKYYSTNGKAQPASLETAVVRGLAPDKGLYMPETIRPLDPSFFEDCPGMSFHDIACSVADAFFGDDIPSEELHRIVCGTLSFDCPVVRVSDRIWSLELFHGPTLAFKDVGARFMARVLGHFTSGDSSNPVNVLVATSGDTGSAVANGFLGVEGIRVFVLYPKGKVSPIQECQFTTLGRNITALAVDGVFDDCQALVKQAFADEDLNSRMRLTSANSINVARFLPQSFYYFWAYAQMKKLGLADNLVISVPSGNFGNLCSALFAHAMGLPVKRFIAANNRNDVFYEYLRTGVYSPKPSVRTIANAMDVGNPSNFARIMALYGNDWNRVRSLVSGSVSDDDEIAAAIRDCRRDNGYLLDPHGACGYRSLVSGLEAGETGVFCETAHPAKFRDTVSGIIGQDVEIPARLAEFMKGSGHSAAMSRDYSDFKKFLVNTI